MPLLGPDELRAPIAILSSKKRAALVACLSGGGTLRKHDGVWIAASARPGDKPIAGVTVADLGREGMLTLTVLGESAQLTNRGSWFARTAASQSTESKPD
jgi:hypothetical protein